MDFGNINLILIGIIVIIGTTIIYLIKPKTAFCSKKYFNKLESIYGNIDKKKTVKLEVLYRYVTGLEYIACHLSTSESADDLLCLALGGHREIIIKQTVKQLDTRPL
ncbi:hypothetical protein, partial [Clostridioides difficile]|uniref:hypothetical protein n=1 Tax=Clostridioides difficile TaxID=1496 RepID=UPI001F285A37